MSIGTYECVLSGSKIFAYSYKDEVIRYQSILYPTWLVCFKKQGYSEAHMYAHAGVVPSVEGWSGRSCEWWGTELASEGRAFCLVQGLLTGGKLKPEVKGDARETKFPGAQGPQILSARAQNLPIPEKQAIGTFKNLHSNQMWW